MKDKTVNIRIGKDNEKISATITFFAYILVSIDLSPYFYQ